MCDTNQESLMGGVVIQNLMFPRKTSEKLVLPILLLERDSEAPTTV